jgi:N-ethylmaleimide reductase
MINNGFDQKTGNKVISDKKADMVAYGKLFIANPDLPKRFAENAPLNEGDPDTYYQGGEKGYIDYPFLEEKEV